MRDHVPMTTAERLLEQRGLNDSAVAAIRRDAWRGVSYSRHSTAELAYVLRREPTGRRAVNLAAEIARRTA